jgi:transcriptional regulator with XRE-family HTH domain
MATIMVEKDSSVGPHMRAAGKRIKQWRDKSGMSQQVLADRAGMAQTTVSAFENGRDGVSLEKLAALAEVFGCSLSDVFAETAPKPTEYATLVTAWNALPSDQHRQTLLKMMQAWGVAGRAAARR